LSNLKFSWPNFNAENPRKVAFTREISKTCNDILASVLMDFLPPEFVTQNIDSLPLDQYGLRVYGYDEFLDPNQPLGCHVFIGKVIAFGHDVQLEVGRREMSVNQTSVPYTKFAFNSLSQIHL
jgi:hypothetical protein